LRKKKGKKLKDKVFSIGQKNQNLCRGRCIQGLQQTRLASSLNGRHSPNALTKVVIFFLGSALASASIIGLRGLEKKRIICQIKSPGLILQSNFLRHQEMFLNILFAVGQSKLKGWQFTGSHTTTNQTMVKKD
jgi:hypothetical protein